ncbi:MAG: oxygen-independent coproporphyrinogen III oxidase [Saprospiraceae bacterium]|nr:oxygen-independent coproporphyrinogen III oxidase [Saprospiraceae bacterium]
MTLSTALTEKYDIPAPRYTSYPTVPYWTEHAPDAAGWLSQLSAHAAQDARLSLYIHLPFCERLCTYCGCNKHITRNHAVEIPYLETVLAEWEMYRTHLPEKPVLRELHLGGGTPTFFAPQHLKRLVEGILSSVEVAEDAAFSFEAHPNGATREHLNVLYELGFRRISIGVQDMDDEILRLIHRFQTREEVIHLTEMAREIGYTSINYDLIYGLPRQTQAHIRETMEQVRRLRPDRIAFYSYAHVPWLKNGQRAYDESDLPAAAEKRALYETGRTLLEAEGYEDIGMDHFALPADGLAKAAKNGRLHRNFMGYTEVYTPLSIGLGASAISDIGHAFMQNEKTVADYEAAVRAGRLPVFRGHYLNEEDRCLRRHILNLMCRYRTDWYLPEHQTQALTAAVERLSEPEMDGLVVCGPFSADVTETGKAFLRNLCMAFDARYWARVPDGRVFSQAV